MLPKSAAEKLAKTIVKHEEMKCELEEAQHKVDWEEAERVHKEHERKECEEHEKYNMEHRCEEAAKETQELEVAKAQVAKHKVEVRARAEVGESIEGSDASSDTEVAGVGVETEVSE